MVTKTVTTKKLQFGVWRTWPPLLRSDKHAPRAWARRYFLQRLAVMKPEVLRTLNLVEGDDDAALQAWGTKWRLGSWELAYACETLHLWQLWPRGRQLRVWSPNPAGIKGAAWWCLYDDVAVLELPDPQYLIEGIIQRGGRVHLRASGQREDDVSEPDASLACK